MRVCVECGKQFSSGFIDDDLHQFYYCSEICVDVTYTPTEKKTLQDRGQLYYTDWSD